MSDRPSAAEKADLHPGDVITRVGDRRIESAEDLVGAIGDQDENDVAISYIRHGQRESADVKLDAAPRVMRLRRGPGFEWRDGNGSTRIFQVPNGEHRIRIKDDVKDDDQLRREIQQLKKEIEDEFENEKWHAFAEAIKAACGDKYPPATVHKKFRELQKKMSDAKVENEASIDAS